MGDMTPIKSAAAPRAGGLRSVMARCLLLLALQSILPKRQPPPWFPELPHFNLY
jgi:hypothetical protein